MKQKNKEIHTKSMIALCYIVDDYGKFKESLISNLSSKYNNDFMWKLQDVSEGKFVVGAKKVKRFYEKNKAVIDTINKYSSISAFIGLNYGYYGEPTSDLDFFNEYLLNHKDEIPKTLLLLENLKELGFSKFQFNEDLDFTQEAYTAYSDFDDNYNITYVANPEVIPNYVNCIKYKTTDSNYKMTLGLYGIFEKEISKHYNEIVLNSLSFDPNTLPEKVDKEHIFEPLVEMKNNQNEQKTILKNSVDLSIGVLDLENQFITTNETVNRLNNIQNKEALVETLSNIKENLEKLKTLTDQYNNSILEQEPLLTQEILKKEKKLYLERREMSGIDLC